MSRAGSGVADYYAVLGVSPDASPEEIRRAYRDLAKRFHPDANPDPAAAERMREINEAYAVLSDPAKRAAYDRARAAASSAASAPSGGSGPAPPRPVVTPSVIDFGRLRPGGKATASVVVTNHGGPFGTVRLENEQGPWWGLSAVRGGTSADVVAELELEVFVDPGSVLSPGRHEASVIVHLDDQQAPILLRIEVVDTAASASDRRGAGGSTPPRAPAPPPPPAPTPPPVPTPVAYVERHPVWARIGLALVTGILVPWYLLAGIPGHNGLLIVALLLIALTISAAATTGFLTDPGRASAALQWVAAGVLWLGKASLWAAAIAVAVAIVLALLVAVFVAALIVGFFWSVVAALDE
jgi:hypothetical protein